MAIGGTGNVERLGGLGVWLGKRLAELLLAGISFLREFASAKYDSGNPPIRAIANELFSVCEKAEQGEVDRALLEAIVNLTGAVAHLRATQINRAIDAIWTEADGEDVAPCEYLTGLRERD
jgi:hypothetical protein